MFPLCCPVCGGELSAVRNGGLPGGFACEKHHHFDAAKQGYVNLSVTGSQKVSGDSREMAAARTEFLENGYYEPLSEEINRCAASALKSAAQPCCLADAGCGEGYYTNRLAKTLMEKQIAAVLGGFDLSKYAIMHGAKEARRIGLPVQYAVASLFHMPVKAESCDGILNLFAPCAAEEFYRVLRPGGFLLMATAGENHLWEFKNYIYQNPYRNVPRRDRLRGFEMIDVIQLTYRIQLQSADDIQALFSMTPYFWKTSRKDAQKLRELRQMETTAAFDVLLYRKLRDSSRCGTEDYTEAGQPSAFLSVPKKGNDSK